MQGVEEEEWPGLFSRDLGLDTKFGHEALYGKALGLYMDNIGKPTWVRLEGLMFAKALIPRALSKVV